MTKDQNGMDSFIMVDVGRGRSARLEAESKQRHDALADLQYLSEQTKAIRRRQRKSGQSGITGVGDESGTFASAKDIQPNVAHGRQRSHRGKGDSGECFPQSPVRRSEPIVTISVRAKLLYKHDDLVTPAKDDFAKRAELLRNGADTLLQGAAERFGKGNIDGLHIGNNDIGSATSALLLGPEICKFIGRENTSLFGKQLLVFGIAPLFGASEEARVQFDAANLTKTIHDGAGNFLTGTAIGAALSRLHPAILLAAITGGVGLIANDQLNSPEHKKRNAELVQIANNLANCDDAALLAFAERSKSLLGADYYKAAFDLATGGAGLPEGQYVGNVAKEESSALLKKINVAELAENLQNIGKTGWKVLSDFVAGPSNKWRFAMASEVRGGLGNQFESAEESILRMVGKPRSAAVEAVNAAAINKLEAAMQPIAQGLRELPNLPIHSKLQSLVDLNRNFIALQEHEFASRPQSWRLAELEENFVREVKSLQADTAARKVEAEALDAQNPETLSEEGRAQLERYFAQEDAIYTIITDKLKSTYGWNGKTAGMLDKASAYSTVDGMNAQQSANNAISELLNKGLERDRVILDVFKKNGVSPDRAKDWVGIPLSGTADSAGCDYLLVNKSTGEAYTFDMTLQVLGASMKHGRLADSPLTNARLEFLADKSPPKDRLDTVIGLADENLKDDLIRLSGLSKLEGKKMLAEMQSTQLAQIIGETISKPSKLNIIDSAIPSTFDSSFSRVTYELWRFRSSLERNGYKDWAKSLNKAIGWAKSEHGKTKSMITIPFY